MGSKSYIVTLKPNTTDAEAAKFKEDIKAKGGKIEHEYTLIKGFSYSIPDGGDFSVFANCPIVENHEADQEMKAN